MNQMYNLTIARKKRHLTQSDLARKLGVKVTTVSAWETGRHRPKMGTLLKLAEMLNVSIDYLVQDWRENDGT